MGQYKDYIAEVESQLKPIRNELRDISIRLETMADTGRPLRVVVAGGFSCGKSAFINRILGEDVAVEGTTPTTRCSTEYFYSPELCWMAEDGHLTNEEYRRRSCREGSQERFRVGVPSIFLKQGVKIVDTPGFGDNNTDNDNAVREINGCDILFWLVNATNGTILGSELDVLAKATVTEDGGKPLAVILTQVDVLTGDAKCSAKDKFILVKEKIVEQLREKKLRLVFSPQAASSKPAEEVVPSVRPLVAEQDVAIMRIVEKCKQLANEACRAGANVWASRQNNLAMKISEKCHAAADYLAQQKKNIEHRVERAVQLQKSAFREELIYLVEVHLGEVADDIGSGNNAIVSSMYRKNWIWDDYVAEFNPSAEFLCSKSLYAKIGKLLAKFSDYSKKPFCCRQVVDAFLKEIDVSVRSVVVDSWSSDNRAESRRRVAAQLKNKLKFMHSDVIGKILKTHFSMPEVKWKSLNIDAMRAELAEIDICMKQLKDIKT